MDAKQRAHEGLRPRYSSLVGSAGRTSFGRGGCIGYGHQRATEALVGSNRVDGAVGKDWPTDPEHACKQGASMNAVHAQCGPQRAESPAQTCQDQVEWPTVGDEAAAAFRSQPPASKARMSAKNRQTPGTLTPSVGLCRACSLAIVMRAPSGRVPSLHQAYGSARSRMLAAIGTRGAWTRSTT